VLVDQGSWKKLYISKPAAYPRRQIRLMRDAYSDAVSVKRLDIREIGA
jgi:hypothetical protein